MTGSSTASRDGILAGVAAYGIWGLFPLYWPLLKPATPGEILAHRIVWSLVLCLGLLLVVRRGGWLRWVRPLLATGAPRSRWPAPRC